MNTAAMALVNDFKPVTRAVLYPTDGPVREISVRSTMIHCTAVVESDQEDFVSSWDDFLQRSVFSVLTEQPGCAKYKHLGTCNAKALENAFRHRVNNNKFVPSDHGKRYEIGLRARGACCNSRRS